MTDRVGWLVRAPFEGDTIRVGVVGGGFGALVHIPALSDLVGVEVVAICDVVAPRAEEIAHERRIPMATDDYQHLLASGEVDAVTLAVPPYLHHSMAVAACEEGVHVLCESPLALSAAEARDLEQLVRDSSVCHGVAFHRRYEPARQRMKQLVDEGFIGDLHSVSVIVYRSTLNPDAERPQGWRMNQEQGGGILSTVACDYVDQLRWWFGEIHAASGLTYTAVRDRVDSGFGERQLVDADDNAAFVVRFASGAIGSVNISHTAATDVGEEIVVSGSEGMLAIQEPDQIVGARRGGHIRGVMPGSNDRARQSTDRLAVEHFRGLAAGWIEAIRTGEPFAPSFADGARVQEVLDAVTQSQRLRRWIDLSGEKWPV